MISAKEIKSILEAEDISSFSDGLHDIADNVETLTVKKLKVVGFRSLVNNQTPVCSLDLSFDVDSSLGLAPVKSYVKSFNEFFDSARFNCFIYNQSDSIELRIYTADSRVESALAKVGLSGGQWDACIFSVKFYYDLSKDKLEIYLDVRSFFLNFIIPYFVDRHQTYSVSSDILIDLFKKCTDEMVRCVDIIIKAVRLAEVGE